MKKVKITVLKTHYFKDLAEEYCNSSTSTCPCFQLGQEFLADFDQPDGFCGWAWNDIQKYVVTLLGGGDFASGAYDGWMKTRNTMIASCTDGIRPVVFKLELIEELEPI